MGIVILCVMEIVVLLNHAYFKNALCPLLPAGTLKFAACFNLHSGLNTLLFSFHLASICQSRPLHNIRATDDRLFLRFRPASSISATPSVALAIIARLLSLNGNSVSGCAVTGRAGYS